MWDYSETVKEHFFNPKNARGMDDANAIGDVGSIQCGDALRLTLKVDPESEVIQDAAFQTFGCGSAIASSSVLTEIIKGKTLDEALLVTNQDIADQLDGLPPEKMHCSVMGREALQAAVANYRGEEWSDDHEEGALICKCFAVDAVMIEETVRANNLRTVEDVTNYTKAGGGCSACHEGIEEILTRVLAETGEAFNARASRRKLDEAKEPKQVPGKGMSNLERIRRIERVIEAVRPQLQRDRGDVTLVDVDGDTVFINLVGACSGCQMASLTISGIQQQMMEDLGEFVRVVPVPAKAGVAA
ncbi:Fe-S cluster assembly protein NifU [Mariprofundus ferrooxydans]|uniref:Fe-S cluster assembly protein NifU n=1 Tax=Mariprofundus ferrooxydans TaxID=314344 RepID=UPI001430973E|nr:Fe-S cluster assembly protein NifU [Mariprofundus ferrooxydans]